MFFCYCSFVIFRFVSGNIFFKTRNGNLVNKLFHNIRRKFDCGMLLVFLFARVRPQPQTKPQKSAAGVGKLRVVLKASKRDLCNFIYVKPAILYM